MINRLAQDWDVGRRDATDLKNSVYRNRPHVSLRPRDSSGGATSQGSDSDRGDSNPESRPRWKGGEVMATTTALAILRGKWQTSITFNLDDYGILQRSSAAKETSVSELVGELIQPGLVELRKKTPARDDDC